VGPTTARTDEEDLKSARRGITNNLPDLISHEVPEEVSRSNVGKKHRIVLRKRREKRNCVKKIRNGGELGTREKYAWGFLQYRFSGRGSK